LFRQRGRKIHGDCGLSVPGQRAGNQETLQLSCIPKLTKAHSQEPEPLGAWPARVGVENNSTFGLDVRFLNWYLRGITGFLNVLCRPIEKL
jgi:hypothetical protein